MAERRTKERGRDSERRLTSAIAPSPALRDLKREAAGCRACPLWQRATQTVFGEGAPKADIMLVGEQPGDREDLQGHPFVGPAGLLLERAIASAGLDRRRIYRTNVVKHFKWEQRGKKRIHQRPDSQEIAACRPWLDAELAAVRPTALVCLGATAAQALFGRGFKVTRQRGSLVRSSLAPLAMGTVHPSAILRLPDEESRRQGFREFVSDLEHLRLALGGQEQPA